MLRSRFTLLKPVVPGMALYMRGYFNDSLLDALRDADERLSEGRTLLAGGCREMGDESLSQRSVGTDFWCGANLFYARRTVGQTQSFQVAGKPPTSLI